MTIEINLGNKKEKRLVSHLKVEHPSVRGNIKIRKGHMKRYKGFENVPDFKEEAEEFNRIQKVMKGGKY